MHMNIDDIEAVKTLIEPVASEIENLSDRIARNRSAVSANETATRNYLIEPLLRTLGWDIADPDLVTPEYSAGQGRVDYALMHNDAPIVLIEAKKLGTKLSADTLLQAFGYANDQSVKFVAISNGENWEIHRTPLSSRDTVASFAVTSDSPYAAALEAAKLSREVLVASEHEGATERATRSFGDDHAQRKIHRRQSEEVGVGLGVQDGKSERQKLRGSDIGISSASDDWVTLGEVRFHTGDPRPRQVLVPDQKEPIQISSYKDLWVQVVEWLLRNETRIDWEQYFCDRFASFVPPDPKKQPHPRQLSNGLWLATNYSTIYTGQNIKSALNRFGRELHAISVTFSSGRKTKPSRSPSVESSGSVTQPTALARPIGGESDDMDWYSVDDRSWSATHKKPSAVKILGALHEVKEWADFSQLIATWLIETGRLEHKDCPVSVTTAKRCLVNTEPAHPDGKPFFGHSRRPLPKDMWIETNQGADQHVEYASRLLRKFSVDPDSVMVKVG